MDPAAGTIHSTLHWPGMRTVYVRLPPHAEWSTTGPHQIGVAFSGHRGLTFRTAGRTWHRDVPAGVTYVAGDEPITWLGVADDTEALEIYPEPSLVDSGQFDGWRGVRPAYAVPDATAFGLAAMLRRAHIRHADVATSAAAELITNHLVHAYGNASPPHAAGRLPTRVIDRVAAAVDERLDGTIGLTDLAATAGLSEFHFARCFKATTGLTPHRFVTARRLAAARQRLQTSRTPVAEAAFAVGFSNVGHFRRLYQREYGQLPGETRR